MESRTLVVRRKRRSEITGMRLPDDVLDILDDEIDRTGEIPQKNIEDITEELTGRADLVVMARVLVHASRPQDAIAAATRLLKPGGHVAIIDALPHDDESLREQGHVWLGFEPAKLRAWLEAAHLHPIVVHPFPSHPTLQLAVGRKETSHGHSH